MEVAKIVEVFGPASGEADEAECRARIRAREQEHGPDHLSLYFEQRSLWRIITRNGTLFDREGEALALSQSNLALMESAYGEAHPVLAEALIYLATTLTRNYELRDGERMDEAEKHLRHAMRLIGHTHENDENLSLIPVRAALARLLARKGAGAHDNPADKEAFDLLEKNIRVQSGAEGCARLHLLKTGRLLAEILVATTPPAPGEGRLYKALARIGAIKDAEYAKLPLRRAISERLATESATEPELRKALDLLNQNLVGLKDPEGDAATLALETRSAIDRISSLLRSCGSDGRS